MKQNEYRRITVAEMAPHIHSFLPNENKVEKLSKWLISWINSSLECGKIKYGDFLPTKADLACHIGVSQGTMQNVFRLVEDEGIIESKQRIGTYIKNRKKESTAKLTSKREMAIEKIKIHITENSYNKGDILMSSRDLAKELEMGDTTLRAAMSALVANNILKKKNKTFIIVENSFNTPEVKFMTLVDKVALRLKDYIKNNLKEGDKLASNGTLAGILKVSVKTIHDAIKILAKEGIVYTRRGRYGTIVAAQNSGNIKPQIYEYEKFEHKIQEYINAHCSEGDKLPSIKEFAKKFQTSEKTIKKALDNLAEEGYLTFSRGRYGGTFVLDIPQTSAGAYTWLALNSEYIPTSNGGEILEN